MARGQRPPGGAARPRGDIAAGTEEEEAAPGAPARTAPHLAAGGGAGHGASAFGLALFLLSPLPAAPGLIQVLGFASSCEVRLIWGESKLTGSACGAVRVLRRDIASLLKVTGRDSAYSSDFPGNAHRTFV